MASSLRVNFHKTKIGGERIDNDLLSLFHNLKL